MKTSIQDITPDIARMFLKGNISNRTIRNTKINVYASDMAKGRWQLTHQGIMIGKNGVVIDGQHRLLAIIKSGVTIKTMVTFSDEIESPIQLEIDRQTPRSLSFITGKKNELIAVASLILQVTSRGMGNSHSASEINDVAELVEPYYKMLMKTKSTTPFITVSNVIVPAMTHLMSNNNNEYVVETFNAMKHDFTKLHKYPASFYRQVVIERIQMTKTEKPAKAYRAFDYEKRNLDKLSVKNVDLAYTEFADALKSSLKGI